MIIKPAQDFEVPGDAPFRNDALHRKENAEVLTTLVGNVNEPFVLSMNASYGSGKTTFLRMWRQHLLNEKFACILVNAWESDYIEDPLAAILGALQEALDQHATKNAKTKKLYGHLKKVGAAVVSRGIPLAVRLATAGVIDDKVIEGGALADHAEKYASELIDSYRNGKDSLNKFKASLKDYIASLSDPGDGEKSKPLVIMVDDLDRCRPNYALEYLERIKHLFHIDSVVFILSYDKKQLASTLRTIYGSKLNVDEYLRKFIDLEYLLPKPDNESFVNLQFKKHNLDAYFTSRRTSHSSSDDGDSIKRIMIALFNIFGLPLRAQEHCFIQLSIVTKTTPHNQHLLPFLLAPLLAIKIANNDLYRKFIDNQVSYKDVLRCIKSEQGRSNFLDTHDENIIEAYLASCSVTRERGMGDLLKEYENSVLSKDERAAEVYDILRSIQHNFSGFPLPLRYIARKMEILEKFHDFTGAENNNNH